MGHRMGQEDTEMLMASVFNTALLLQVEALKYFCGVFCLFLCCLFVNKSLCTMHWDICIKSDHISLVWGTGFGT